MTIKYEDLQHETFFTIKKVINFINKISKSKNLFNRDKAKNSIESCQFDRLKKMEQKQGFQESMIKNDNSGNVNFFNLGQKNDYKKLLDENFIPSICTNGINCVDSLILSYPKVLSFSSYTKQPSCLICLEVGIKLLIIKNFPDL